MARYSPSNRGRVPKPKGPTPGELASCFELDEQALRSKPNLMQFAGKLAKQQIVSKDLNGLRTWSSNPAKCSEGSPEHAIALRLIELAEQMGDDRNAGLVAPPPTSHPQRGQGGGRQGLQDRGDNVGAAEPELIKSPFHNPYTFIPFPTESLRDRRPPTPITIDEHPDERERRMTGVLELTVQTLSPLLTREDQPVDSNAKHKYYRALRIGDDVIVPATGVRGALRTLMTLLTGGTLGYLDEMLWLCQGRDAKIDKKKACLAEVVEPGGMGRGGTVRLGPTRLVLLSSIEKAYRGRRLPRPDNEGRVRPLWSSEPRQVTVDTTMGPRQEWIVDRVETQKNSQCPWRLKLSGRPVGGKRQLASKREGAFLPSSSNEHVVRLKAEKWEAYVGRHRHADKKVLEGESKGNPGDLVWLEPKDPDRGVESAEDVKSIQWARWGREGRRLLKLIWDHHRCVLPDSVNPDGAVDEVTDLFGQVPNEPLAAKVRGWIGQGTGPGPAAAFAGRIRPENLVFESGAQALQERVEIAPLLSPHPGCRAMYRQWSGVDELDKLDSDTPLRGYKVYRNTRERGGSAPWHYGEQGVYTNDHAVRRPDPASGQKVSCAMDLLSEGAAGRLRIGFQALSMRELGLLVAACSIDWRLGGGKPLGLGHCRVTRVDLLTEPQLMSDAPEPATLMTRGTDPQAEPPGDFSGALDGRLAEAAADLAPRLALWHASQLPVERLRYPRAVETNRQRLSRGGHAWFSRHAEARKGEDKNGKPKPGLEVVWTENALRDQVGAKKLRAQALPRFDPERPFSDTLFGYDLIGESRTQQQKKYVGSLKPFGGDAGR